LTDVRVPSGRLNNLSSQTQTIDSNKQKSEVVAVIWLVFVIVLFLFKIRSGSKRFLTGGTYTDLYTRPGFVIKQLRCVPTDRVYMDKVDSVSNWLSKR
jgi:hypothetical protein